MTLSKRAFAWWSLAERAAGRLTTPACDVAKSDVDVERLLAGSSVFAIARTFSAKTGRAWIDSRTALWVRPILLDLLPSSITDRVRVAGFIAFVASLTALALGAISSTRTGWLDSLLPAAMAIVAVFVVAAAQPIARALEDTHR